MPTRLTFADPKGDQSFVLGDKAISTMDTQLAKTNVTGKEHGFPFCATSLLSELNNAGLQPGNECVGSICSVTIDHCSPIIVQEGSFHTHPGMVSAQPSMGDVLFVLGMRHYYHVPAFSCRGASKSGEIRCDVIPVDKFATTEEYNALIKEYQEKVEPIYKEWDRTGVAPPRERWAPSDIFRDRLLAPLRTVVFSNVSDLANANPRFLDRRITVGKVLPKLPLAPIKDKDIGAPKYIKPLPVAVTDVNACSEKYGFKDLQRLMAQNGMTYTGKYDACRKLLAKGVKL